MAHHLSRNSRARAQRAGNFLPWSGNLLFCARNLSKRHPVIQFEDCAGRHRLNLLTDRRCKQKVKYLTVAAEIRYNPRNFGAKKKKWGFRGFSMLIWNVSVRIRWIKNFRSIASDPATTAWQYPNGIRVLTKCRDNAWDKHATEWVCLQIAQMDL